QASPGQEARELAAGYQNATESAGGPARLKEWYYVNSDEQQQGPVTREKLLSLHLAGTITDATPVWKAGMKEWQPLVEAGIVDKMPVPAATQRPGGLEAWEDRLAWRRVRTGLGLILIGLFTLIGAALLV